MITAAEPGESVKVLDRLQRAMSEFLVIVVGVLVALAVDDWRTGRDEARFQVDALHQVQADLALDSADLVDARRGIGNRVVAGLRILERLGRPESDVAWLRQDLASLMAFADGELPHESPDPRSNELMAVFRTRVFDPHEAEFSNLVGSGELHLIRDRDIRAAIVRYYGVVAEMLEGREITRASQAQYTAFLLRHGITPLDLAMGTGDLSDLFSSSQFGAEIMAVLWAARQQDNRLDNIEAARQALARLLADRQ